MDTQAGPVALDRREFLRGWLEQQPDGSLRARKFDRDGSGLIAGLRAATGLIELDEARRADRLDHRLGGPGELDLPQLHGGAREDRCRHRRGFGVVSVAAGSDEKGNDGCGSEALHPTHLTSSPASSAPEASTATWPSSIFFM